MVSSLGIFGTATAKGGGGESVISADYTLGFCLSFEVCRCSHSTSAPRVGLRLRVGGEIPRELSEVTGSNGRFCQVADAHKEQKILVGLPSDEVVRICPEAGYKPKGGL